jgi:hypothetical protein
MKLACIVIVALVLTALLPSAGAQATLSSCKLYEDLIAAAPAKFASYRGKEFAPGVYTVKVLLPQVPTCATFAQAESALLCYGPLGAEAIVRLVYLAELQRMRGCFEGWTTKPLVEVEGPFESVDGLRFVRETAEGVLTVGIGLSREKTGEPRLHRVGFGVTWRPLPAGV